MRIIIAYDGSKSSDAVIDGLQHAGLPATADAVVISVADVFLPPPVTDPLPISVPQVVRRAQELAEREVMEAELLAIRASEQIKLNFPQWNIRHEALAESPAWAIIRAADECKADLIVVGAHGHSFLGSQLILGSVSQRVLYEAGCSVRVARHREGNPDSPLRLIIGVDNSPYSNAAVDAVCRRNWPAGTEVRLVAAVDTVMAIAPDLSQPEVLKWIDVGDEGNWDQVRQVFEPAAERLRSAGLEATVTIKTGNPREELIGESESWGAECIFVGEKGVRGIDRLLLGSVSSAVAARAPCSVEVVRPR
jgi:nucleotide-binding universal stress UspA family protein